MNINLSTTHSLVSNWICELRNVLVQQDRMRFRRNLERIAEVAAYEISKKLRYKVIEVETPLGLYNGKVLESQPIICSILRAGVPMHNGLLSYFDHADNAFVAAYRKHSKDGSFKIELQYVSCTNIIGRTLIICDPMIATGASLVKTVLELKATGIPADIHIVCAIACSEGLDYVNREIPEAIVWCGDIDDELTAKGYIVPGLGDAGDLAFGEKVQQ